MRLSLPWRTEPLVLPPKLWARGETNFEPEKQSSLALPRVKRFLDENPGSGVLDLGAPAASNFGLYAESGARITVVDFYRFFLSPRLEPEIADFDALLPETPSGLDVVLAWDLLNYLSLTEIAKLLSCLRRRTKPSAFLLGFLCVQPEMPAAPGDYRALGDQRFERSGSKSSTIPAPRYAERSLVELADLEVVSRYQLRSGMLEYLFRFRRERV